jgi:multidrug efflux pump subunit AcrA (membrane-fusion protein)
MTPLRLGRFPLALLLLMLPLAITLAACGEAREAQLARELSEVRTQLQSAREQVREARFGCQSLALERDAALASARQLRADTQYLTNSTRRLSDAITRLSYEDWNKVVPEVQLGFGDVESAAHDLDARVGRVLIALKADSD